ncbi:MAG: hypothetical protein ACR2G5_12725 [Pyrinomonadaceae bacterium]
MVNEDNTIGTVRRRQAKSGRVSYGDTVVLSDSSKRRVVVVPFFVPHSDHTELAIRIISYAKAPPPTDWAVIEEKSLSLGEAASRILLSALRTHLAVADSSEDGNYLVVRVSEGTAHLGSHDPATVATALTKILSQTEIVRHPSKHRAQWGTPFGLSRRNPVD